MQQFLAVLRREFTDAATSELGKKTTQIHLTIVLAAVMLGWPISYTISKANWAPALALWVYAELLVLAYLALAVPADALETDSEIRPGDWITYGEASALTVQLAQTLATWLVLAFWLLTAAPAFLLGMALTPIEADRLQELALFAVLFLAALSQIGTWIGATIESRTFRIICVDIAFAGIMIGSLFLRAFAAKNVESVFLVHPLEVAGRILEVSAREVLFGSAAGTMVGLSVPVTSASVIPAGVPWVSIIVMYGGIFIVCAGLTLVVLRQWEQRQKS